MPTASSYDYAIIRLVPCLERGEFVNVGVIVFCRARRFLQARVSLNEQRLYALAPQLDFSEIRRQLDHFVQVCHGTGEAGPLGQLSLSERFHWLVAPRSAMIQTSPVHSGLVYSDPEAVVERLMTRLVVQ